MADLTGKVSIDTGGAQQNLQQLSKVAKDLIKTLQSMNQVATSKDVKGVSGKRIEELSATLSLYTKIGTAAKSYASATKQIAESSEAAAKGGNSLATAMKNAAKAMEEIVKVDGRAIPGLQKTLALYEQQARIAGMMAKADLDAAKAKQTLAKASTEAAKAANLKAGKAAPMSEYQAAMVAMKQQAQAAQAAQRAAQQKEAADKAAAQTARKKAAEEAAAQAAYLKGLDQRAAAQVKAQQEAEKAAQKQAAAQAKLEESQRRLAANTNSTNNRQVSEQQAKIGALKAEYIQVQQLVAVYRAEAQAATAAATAARNAVAKAGQAPAQRLTTAPLSAPDAVKAATAQAKAIAAAQQEAARTAALATTANNNLAAAQSRSATSASALARAQKQAEAALNAEARAAQNTGNAYSNLISTRYALYEVSSNLMRVSRALGGVFQDTVGSAMQYENAFVAVARTTRLTGEELKTLEQGLIDMTQALPLGIDEISKIASLGAQLGISNDQVLEFTDTVAKFAAVTNVSAETATTAFGRLQNLMEVPTAEFKNLGSAIGELGVTSVATEAEILNVSQGIAASAHAAGLGITYTLGLATAMASLRIPPEMARGATQRILFIITKAMSAGGDAAAAFAKTLGTTASEAQALWKSNPEEFFSGVMKGIGQATDAGGDYVKILGDLGIKNSRDIQVVQRLSGSYDVLSRSIQQAGTSYQGGTYLDESAEPMLDTLTNKFTMFMATLKEVGATIGGIFMEPLKHVVDALKWLANGLQAIINNPVGRFLALMAVSFTAIVTVLIAFKAGLAMLGAGLATFRQVMSSGFATSVLSVKGLSRELTVLITELTAARTAGNNTAAANANIAASSNTATAAIGRQASIQAALNRTNSAAGSAGAIAAAGNAAAGAGAGAGAAGGFMGAAKGLLGTFGKAIPIVGMLSLAIIPLIDLFSRNSKKVDEAAEKQKHYNEVINNSGAGGGSGLAAAIAEDTKEFEKQKRALSDATKYTTVYKKTYEDLADGSRNVITWVSRMGGEFERIGDPIHQALNTANLYKTEISEAGDINAKAATGIDTTTTALEGQTYALGSNAAAWQANALATAVNSDEFTPADRGALVTAAQATGQQLKDIIKAAAEGNATYVAYAFNQMQQQAASSLAKVDADIDALSIKQQAAAREASRLSGGGGQEYADAKALTEQLQAEMDALQAARGNAKAYADSIAHLREMFTSTEGPIRDQLNQMLIQAGIQDEVTEGVDEFTGSQNSANDAMGEGADEAMSLSDALAEVAGAFEEVVSRQFDLVNGASAVYEAMETLGKGLAESTDLSSLTEAGRQNLANVQAVVEAYASTLQQGIEQGKLSAVDAAGMMQSYMMQLVEQLAAAGVPTPQLDYLVEYASAIAATDWRLEVGADVTAAINGITSVGEYAAAMQAQIAAMGMPDSAYGSGYRTGVPSSAFSTPTYNGPTSFGGGGASPWKPPAAPDLGAIGQAKDWQDTANAAEDAEQAQKDAGKAGEEAGKAAADAADYAAEKIKKEAEYVKDLASYYEDLASRAMGLMSAEADTFSALSELGASIAENGTGFETFTEGGQANLEALINTMDSFGQTLSVQVQNGSMSAGEATKQYQQFAGGVRSELIKLGVPIAQVDSFFKGIGATANGWAGAAEGVSQYNDVLGSAARFSKEFGDAAVEASERAAEALEKQKQYISDVADAYRNMGSNVMSFYEAQGNVFEALQNMGASIAENGKAFNTVTEAGRANMSALTDVFSSFGDELALQVEQGLISAGTAKKRMAQFAGGIYQELIKMGVKPSEIKTIFEAMGMDASGYANASLYVTQYAGVLTNATKAAKAAADATSLLGQAMAEAKDYAERLGTALDTAFERLFGMSQAKDSTASAIWNMRDAYQASIDKVKELAAANKALDAQISASQVTKNKALYGAKIASKYGETDRAADYNAQAAAAQVEIDDAKKQKAANDKEAKAIKNGTGALKGNSKEAIANRATLLQLQNTMFDQIEAYAATGASQAQVIKYTKEMKKQFDLAAKQAGYSSKDLKPYTNAFDTYVKAIKNVPKHVNTTVTANTSPAQAALRALPDTQTYTVTAHSETKAATDALTKIPDKQDYLITAKTSTKTATDTLARIKTKGTYSITAKASSVQIRGEIGKVPKKGDYVVRVKTAAPGTSGSIGSAKAAINSAMNAFKPTVSVGMKPAVDKPTFFAQLGDKLSGSSAWANIKANIPSLNIEGNTSTGSYTIRGSTTGYKPVAQGGLITPSGGVRRGFADGGFVPGKPPANPRTDNLLAVGPTGTFGIRSGEYVNPQPSVNYYGVDFFDALRERKISRMDARMAMSVSRGMSSGGSTGGSGGGGGKDAMMVYLSPDDRALLRAAANRPIDLYSSNDKIATSTARGNRMLAARGGK